MESKYREVRQLLLSLYEIPDINYNEKKLRYDIYLYELRKLAYKGYAEAQYDLAQHYEDMSIWGISNPYRNVKKKFYWYSKAASNNFAAAFNNLADMYEIGEGVNVDINKALELYKKAGKLGDINGKDNYKILLKQIRKKKC